MLLPGPMIALARLAMTLSLSWLAIAMASAAGPPTFVAISGDVGLSGAYFGTHSLFAALGAIAGGRAMDAWGRRRALGSAHLIAAFGFAIVGLASARGSLPILVCGVAMFAFGVGAIYLTRVVAAELSPRQGRARAVARVQIGATLGAIAGPFVVVAAIPLALALRADARTVAWLLMPIVFVVNALVLFNARDLDAPRIADREAGALAQEKMPMPIPRLPLLAAVGALVAAQAVMTATMGVAVVQLDHAGHAARSTALLVALHFVAMFACSLWVGRLADRAGRLTTIMIGLGLTAIAGGAFALDRGDVPVAIGLLIAGLGWSFAYIGGSVLLADITPIARRGRIVGTVDFASAIVTAAASFAAGAWYGSANLVGIGLVSMIAAALPAVVVAWLLNHPRASRNLHHL